MNFEKDILPSFWNFFLKKLSQYTSKDILHKGPQVINSALEYDVVFTERGFDKISLNTKELFYSFNHQALEMDPNIVKILNYQMKVSCFDYV